MKKKFLLYVAVITTCLFLGFTVYYLAKNDENISMKMDNEQTTYINVGEFVEWPIIWTKPYKDTTLSVVISNENVLKYEEETKTFEGKQGGYTNVTITPSNKNFGPFVFDVYVGDGQQGSPFVIRSAEDLAQIGVKAEFSSDKYYTLSNDIDLKLYNGGKWAALPEFNGNLNGNGHTIYNLNLQDGTYAGLFTKLSTKATVENIKFERVCIEGSYNYVGSVAGVNNGFIGKVSVNGTITNTKNSETNGDVHTGGLVGLNQYAATPAYINMCSVNIAISSQGYTGGLVGENLASVILNSQSTVTSYTGASLYLFGGIAGVNQSIYEDEMFYPALIAKSYVIVDGLTAATNVGIIVGRDIENKSENTLHTNKYQDVIYVSAEGVDSFGAIYENEGSVGLDNLVEYFTKETITEVSKAELTNIDTYVNFNFESVWKLEANSYAEINMLGAYETIIVKGVGEEYSSTEGGYTLLEYLEELRGNSYTSTYYVNADTEIDLAGAEWQTIAKTIEAPFTASIIVEEGIKCVIKNFKLSGDNTSFFGHISGNTMIDGIHFENVTIHNTTGNEAAVVATTLTNGATIKNIKVNNLTSATNVLQSATICANNQATISNCEATGVVMSVAAKQGELRYIGGIVACNSGLISGSTANNFTLQISTTNSNGNFYIGGVAGLTEGNILNCAANVFTLETSNSGSMSVGGIVGYALSKGGDINQPIAIDKSYAKATISLYAANENIYLGGIAGTIANGVSITNSAYKSGSLKAYMAAGIVALNYGRVATSYAEGSVKGSYVSGLIVVCHGEMTNCYTLSTLSGNDKSSIVAGIVVSLGENCYVDKIFSSARFTGEGQHYAETQSVFRLSTVGKWLRSVKGDVNFGTFKNLVIVNYGKATVQKSSIFGGKGGWIEASDEDCKGKDGYAVMKEKAGFDSAIWNFGNNGAYPTLIDAVVVG